MQWGFWDKKTGEFVRFYRSIWQEDTRMDGVQLHLFKTELEAIAALEMMKELSTYPEQYYSYEIMEIPADEPVWKSYD